MPRSLAALLAPGLLAAPTVAAASCWTGGLEAGCIATARPEICSA